jgi:hypothetical protein
VAAEFSSSTLFSSVAEFASPHFCAFHSNSDFNAAFIADDDSETEKVDNEVGDTDEWGCL